jgi:hypothetical protein
LGELGTTDDPRSLVPGDPTTIWEMAGSYKRISIAFEDIGLGFRTIDDGGWTGPAADAFHAHCETRPKRFLVAADAFVSAAAALDDYAYALSWAQRQAAHAIALTTDAESAADEPGPSARPRPTFAQEVERTGVVAAEPGPATPAMSRTALRAAAAATLTGARTQLRKVGKEAARKLRAAGNLAPARVAPPTTVPPVAVPVKPARVPAQRQVKPLVVRIPAPPDVAANHPDAALKARLDHALLRDAPGTWAAGIPGLAKRLRLLELDQLSPRLRQHLFEGHCKRRPRGTGYRDLGYHHREGGVDRGPVRVREVIAGPDEAGVYRAVVASAKTEGGPETKTSSFFPDAWTRAEVERAIRHAFVNRTYFDGRGHRVRRKWRGSYRNVQIEGYVECQFIEPAIDARSARLYHVVTAYPVLRGGGNNGQDA